MASERKYGGLRIVVNNNPAGRVSRNMRHHGAPPNLTSPYTPFHSRVLAVA